MEAGTHPFKLTLAQMVERWTVMVCKYPQVVGSIPTSEKITILMKSNVLFIQFIDLFMKYINILGCSDNIAVSDKLLSLKLYVYYI